MHFHHELSRAAGSRIHDWLGKVDADRSAAAPPGTAGSAARRWTWRGGPVAPPELGHALGGERLQPEPTPLLSRASG